MSRIKLKNSVNVGSDGVSDQYTDQLHRQIKQTRNFITKSGLK